MAEFKLVHIQFHNPQGQTEAAQKAAWERAHQIAQWPGLIWKIWTYDPEQLLAGGTYLFEDAASAQAYLESPIVASMKAVPGVSQFQARLLDVDAARSVVTRAPLRGGQADE